MHKWEYLVATMRYNEHQNSYFWNGPAELNDEGLERGLNYFGKKGWELVTSDENLKQFIFKRLLD